MTVRIDWFDEQKLVLAYLSAEVRLRDLVEPVDSENADDRFRRFNELIVIQDARKFSGRERGTNMAMEMAETYGPDPEYKSAYIVKNIVDLGLVRIFNAYRGRHPDSVEVFLELEPAMVFLGFQGEAMESDCYARLQKSAQHFGEELWF